jgi:hypothetical protein
MKVMTDVSVTMPLDYWVIIRQVIEQTVTAKGREGTQMLLTIFDAFDDAGVVLPDPPIEAPADS